MNSRISRPCSSTPSTRGAPSKPRAARWRSKAWTVGVHGPVGRRTVSPTRTTPALTLPPASDSSSTELDRLRAVAGHDHPAAQAPSRDDAGLHVRVLLSEAFGDLGGVADEGEDRAIRRVGQRTRMHELAALERGA